MPHNNMQFLTVDYINAHVGETIQWYARGYRHNRPYSGQGKLTGQWKPAGMHGSRMHPIVTDVKGNDLNLSFTQFGDITYSDDDRPVSFIKIESNH